jgi:hypothetical protein
MFINIDLTDGSTAVSSTILETPEDRQTDRWGMDTTSSLCVRFTFVQRTYTDDEYGVAIYGIKKFLESWALV